METLDIPLYAIFLDDATYSNYTSGGQSWPFKKRRLKRVVFGKSSAYEHLITGSGSSECEMTASLSSSPRV
jgi:hypothetical protein